MVPHISTGCPAATDKGVPTEIISVLVARWKPHAYRLLDVAGAQMTETADGDSCGTIGGGILEANAIKLADRALRDGTFQPTYQPAVPPKGRARGRPQ